MKKILHALAPCLLVFSAATAQVSLPYTTGFDNAGQQNGWQQFRKGVDSQFQEWDFDNAQAVSDPSALTHYYPVGGADPMDDWFVSPAFDISGGGMLDSLRYYFSGFGVPQAGDTVFIYLLNGNADPDLATSVDILYEFSGLAYINDNTWRLLEPIALPAQSGNSYIAFRYRTVNNWLDVRFDNVGISGDGTVGLEELDKDAVTLFPNPVTDGRVQFQTEANLAGKELEVFNTTGQLVYSATLSGNEAIDLPLAAGCYTYRLLENGTAASLSAGRLVIP